MLAGDWLLHSHGGWVEGAAVLSWTQSRRSQGSLSASRVYPHSYIYIYNITLYYTIVYYRRKFRSQTSNNMDRWKAEQGRGREKRRVEERRSKKRKSQKKADADARKGRKVAKHCVFPMICGSGGSKSRLAKAAGAEPAGQMRDEQLHAVVVRSTFPSEKVQNTWVSEHFWKLRCRKSARRCGANHISKWKCTKHTIVGPVLEVEMSKKCTPAVARSTFRSQNAQNTPLSDHFWKLRCRQSARHCGAQHISKWTCTKHTILGPLLEVESRKVHAVGARSTFPSQNVQSTPRLDHFWTFRARFAWQAQGIVHLLKSE